MYLSAGQAAPTDEALKWLVEDAARLWAKIPSSELPVAIDQAIIEAAPYVATCPLVAKCWMDYEKKELVLGNGCKMSESKTVDFARWIIDEERVDPKIASEFFGGIAEALREKK